MYIICLHPQTAGLLTLNTMTLMPLLLAGAAFAKVTLFCQFLRLLCL